MTEKKRVMRVTGAGHREPCEYLRRTGPYWLKALYDGRATWIVLAVRSKHEPGDNRDGVVIRKINASKRDERTVRDMLVEITTWQVTSELRGLRNERKTEISALFFDLRSIAKALGDRA